MRRKQLLTTLVLLLTAPLWVMAQQYWESGTSKTGAVSKNVHDVWYTISLPEDGEVTITHEPLGNISGENITLYAVVDGENVQRDFSWVDGSNRTFNCPNLKPGIYKVKMHANPRNDKASGTYRLTYVFTAPTVKTDPTPNATWDDCPLLQSGVTLGGHMGYAYAPADVDNVDWFKIEVPKDGKVQFEFRSAPTLTVGYVELCALNAEGTDVMRRGGQWLDHPDSTLVFEVPNCQAGTYYFYMPRRGGYGIYHLTYRFIPPVTDSDPELNDTWQTATPLADGVLQNSHLGYAYNNNQDVVDWYSIEVPEDGKLTIVARSNSTLTIGYAELCALNADQTGVDRRNGKWLDYRDSTLVFETPNVSAGTYYLYMPLRGGYGTYTVTSYFTGHSAEADPEPNDEWVSATPLRQGPAVTGQLGYDYNNTKDIYDWYKLNVPEEGKITLTISSETTLTIGYGEICVPNAEGTSTIRRNGQWLDHPGDTLTFVLNNAAAGDYYLYLPLRGGYGTYSLQYTFTPCAMANDAADNGTWDTAAIIEAGTTKDARLGYDYSNSFNDHDWFRLDVPEEGAIQLTICSEKTLTLGYAEICVPNAEGTSTIRRDGKWLDHPGDTITFSLNNAAAGAYYLYMPLRGGYGGYRITYDFIPCAIANDIAGNDSWENTTLIENGTITQGRLGYDYSNSLDNQDWYQFVMPADGSASFIIQSEKTLTLGYAEILALNADGTGTVRREGKWLDYPDSALVFKRDDLAAGTYYLYVPHRGGYGGYTVKSTFTKNPFYQQKMTNTDFANRITLQEGVPVQGTMGYAYRGNDAATEAWFDLGLMHGRQIDVTVNVESSHSLSIGVVGIYKYKGDRDDGAPILERVKDLRLERSSGTISYLDKNTEDSHYIFYMPRYSGYGGYAVTFGNPVQEGQANVSSDIAVMTGGRNTVRKGVPCENPITITNTSAQKTGKFLVSITATDNIDILGFRMPSNRGTQYLPVDSVTVLDGATCQHTIVFLVPSLDPWESYTFTMVSEGKGDIAYSRDYTEFYSGKNKIVVNSTTFAVVAILGNVEGADRHINVSDYVVHRLGDVYELTGEQRLKVSQLMDQLNDEKEQTGMAAYSVLELLKRASELCGMDLIDATCPLISLIRQHVFGWIYQTDIDDEFLDILDGKAAINDVVASWDPNEMVGPAGVGEQHYIGETQTVNYRILFENKAEAGDAAYRVRISDELDENVFDVSTVRFGETSHDGVGYNWVMKREGNKLSWDIQGIELPPNVNAPEGEGYVSFSVDLKPGLKDGTVISNKATIIFDKNLPIETNVYSNTLDLTPPVTVMASADYDPAANTIHVKCQSQDAASGVQSYLLFASHNGADYAYYGQTFAGEMDYAVENYVDGDAYSFYVLAIDNVGNTENVTPQGVQAITGINGVRFDHNATLRIYTTDGRYVGNNPARLPKGVYVVGGKKFIVR